MPGPIEFELKFSDEALKLLNNAGVRERITEQYVTDCKNVKGTWKERNEQLRDLRKEYIKKYLDVSPSIVDVNLMNFVDTLFYEFDRTRFVVKDVLQARNEVWNEILDIYSAGKINSDTLERLICFIGVDKEFYDNNFLVGGVGSAFVNTFSLFDSKIVNRRMTHRAMGINLSAVKATFQDEGRFHSQIEEIEENKVNGCFDSNGCKQYMYDILKNASEFGDGKDALANAIRKNLTEIGKIELSSSSTRTYLDLTFETEEMYWDRIPQSISDYQRYGAQYEPAYKTETYKYNPEFIIKYLPKGLELKKDDNGYYLVQRECKITNNELKKTAERYSPKEIEPTFSM